MFSPFISLIDNRTGLKWPLFLIFASVHPFSRRECPMHRKMRWKTERRAMLNCCCCQLYERKTTNDLALTAVRARSKSGHIFLRLHETITGRNRCFPSFFWFHFSCLTCPQLRQCILIHVSLRRVRSWAVLLDREQRKCLLVWHYSCRVHYKYAN